jgi:predicted ATPase with chaperone activity
MGLGMCRLGTLLDRIDLHIEVPNVPYQELSATADGTGSVAMREQVAKARAVQRDRFGTDGPRLNTLLGDACLTKVRFAALLCRGKRTSRPLLSNRSWKRSENYESLRNLSCKICFAFSSSRLRVAESSWRRD